MLNVMLIDDHPVVRAGLRAILNAFPDIDVVLEGADGADVAKLAAPDAPHVDVVICDIQMPGTDGIAATSQLAQAGGPPVLILTTYDTQSDIVSAVEAALHDAVLATAAGKRTLAPEVAALLAERITRPEVALSSRELEILEALATGKSNKELAQRLFISEATVKTHLIHIYQKLGVDTRTAAVTVARERKLI